MKHARLFLLALSSVLAACSSNDDSSTGNSPHTNTPNDPTGNPCNLDSGFPGDDMCIPPPPAGEGIQLHVGPASYTDQAVLEPWLLEGGQEDVKCFVARVKDGGFYYLRQENRMRPGSHHMLINLIEDDGRAEGPSTACDALGGLGSVPGSQTPKRDFPEPGTLAPEDAGLARYLPAGSLAVFQLHYVNTGTDPVLREAWINLYKMAEAEVKQRLQSVFLVADLATNIAPKTRATLTQSFTPTLPGPTRIYALNSHMHAHSETMAVWRVRGGQKELVYQSFDWAEPRSATYNTVVKNPIPDARAKTDGGISGLLIMEPGDSLEWSCDVNNTLDTTIRFANEAYTAEMCLLAGAYVSDTPGLFAGGCVAGQCSNRFRP